ncbi:MAG: hypothetical protein Q8K36_01115, partial [Alphaproteobacteria bacterium]|nr:hypothetical protein [Alphaproteobacteria bacterium]
ATQREQQAAQANQALQRQIADLNGQLANPLNQFRLGMQLTYDQIQFLTELLKPNHFHVVQQRSRGHKE